MPPFDVMDLEAPLFGMRLLEASAGTGKTFTIEHLFVRLLLEAPPNEAPLVLEQILAITFTRAAAREMRMRIRTNIKKALLVMPRMSCVLPCQNYQLNSKTLRKILNSLKNSRRRFRA